MLVKPKTNPIAIQQKLLKKFRSLSKIMSPKGDVKVFIQGDKAFTDMKDIYLPAGDFNDPDYLVMLEGLIDHEVGHVCHSAKSAIEKSIEISPLCKWITNAIEDVRMERLVMSTFLGSRKNLALLVDQCLKLGWFVESVEGDSAIQKVTSYILMSARYEYCQQGQLKNAMDTARTHSVDLLGQDVISKIDLILSKIPTLTHSDGAFGLSKEIIDLLASEQSKPDEDKSESGESSEDKSESGESSEDKSESGESSEDKSESGESSEDKSESGESSEDKSESGKSSDDESDESKKDVLKQCLEASEGDLPEDIHQKAREFLEEKSREALDSGAISNIEQHPLTLTRIKTSYEQLDFEAANKASSKVKSPLVRALIDINTDNVSYSKRGLGIDSSKLSGIPCGNHQVFRTESQVRSPNTAIQILVDNSGSMKGYKMRLANASSYALAKGIDSVTGAKSEVLYYPMSNTQVYVAKEFDQRIGQVKSNFEVGATGGTPTGRALQLALQRLAIRAESKKMLFVITDGNPNYNEFDLLERTLHEAKVLGVHVCCFGIGSNKVIGFDSVGYVQVNDITQLHIAVKDAIRANLMGK
jgi:cobaltochelatase CobT